MKVLLVVLLALVVDSSTASSLACQCRPPPASGPRKVCEAVNGKNLFTFSGMPQGVAFPCKYNAIRDLRCGSWIVNLSPTNQLQQTNSKRFVTSSIFLGVENVLTGLKWEGRTDTKIARKYQEDLKEAPFNQLDGALSTADVFTFSARNEEDYVSLTEKNGDFEVIFGLFDPESANERASGFRFECFSDTFVPTDFSKQLCGNGTDEEAHDLKKANEWKEARRARTVYNVFTNPNIVQTDNDCRSTAKAMSNKCDEDQQYEAAKLCWPFVGKTSYRRCISQNLESPVSAFRHCVEFLCSGYTDQNACVALGDEIDMCDKAEVISEKVRDTCKSDIIWK